MQPILDWIKSAYKTCEVFFKENYLIFLLAVCASVIIVFYVLTRIFTCRNYNKIMARKFKKLNVIIRNYQIKEDREKFLINFNKEVSKKNKYFGEVWNNYLKDPTSKASDVFEQSLIKPLKKPFFNFFLIFCWVVCVCGIGVILSLNKFDFKGENAIYVLILIPLFIISFSILLNLAYIMSLKKRGKQLQAHFNFFKQVIDDAVTGFVKNDFLLSGGGHPIEIKENNSNIESYQDFQRSGRSTINQDDKQELERLVLQKSLDGITKKIDNIEQDKDVKPIHQNESESEETLQMKKELLKSLEKLKNIETSDTTSKESRKTFSNFEVEDDDDDVEINIEELVKAKKDAIIKKSIVKKEFKKPNMINKVEKNVLAGSGQNVDKKSKKDLNGALGNLLEVAKKARIKTKN